MTEAPTALLSTGGLAARLGYSMSAIQKFERQGRIPPGIVIEGSGRKVWYLADLPRIQHMLRENGRRTDRAA